MDTFALKAITSIRNAPSILVIGPPKSGKSTLINALSDLFPAPTTHTLSSTLDNNAITAILRSQATTRPPTRVTVVIDDASLEGAPGLEPRLCAMPAFTSLASNNKAFRANMFIGMQVPLPEAITATLDYTFILPCPPSTHPLITNAYPHIPRPALAALNPFECLVYEHSTKKTYLYSLPPVSTPSQKSSHDIP